VQQFKKKEPGVCFIISRSPGTRKEERGSHLILSNHRYSPTSTIWHALDNDDFEYESGRRRLSYHSPHNPSQRWSFFRMAFFPRQRGSEEKKKEEEEEFIVRLAGFGDIPK